MSDHKELCNAVAKKVRRRNRNVFIQSLILVLITLALIGFAVFKIITINDKSRHYSVREVNCNYYQNGYTWMVAARHERVKVFISGNGDCPNLTKDQVVTMSELRYHTSN
jgi:hypothetical protein